MRVALPQRKPAPSKPRTDWHQWFAWRPVVVSNNVVWLEEITRRLVINDLYDHGFVPGGIMTHWEYRL